MRGNHEREEAEYLFRRRWHPNAYQARRTRPNKRWDSEVAGPIDKNCAEDDTKISWRKPQTYQRSTKTNHRHSIPVQHQIGNTRAPRKLSDDDVNRSAHTFKDLLSGSRGHFVRRSAEVHNRYRLLAEGNSHKSNWKVQTSQHRRALRFRWANSDVRQPRLLDFQRRIRQWTKGSTSVYWQQSEVRDFSSVKSSTVATSIPLKHSFRYWRTNTKRNGRSHAKKQNRHCRRL